MPATFTVTELFEDRRLRGGLRAGGGGVEKTTNRLFAVKSSAPCTLYEVAAAPEIPRIGDPFRGPSGFLDTGVYCNSVEPRQRNEGRLEFLVECGYTNELAPGAASTNGLTNATGTPADPRLETDSPLLDPPTYRFDQRSIQVTVYEDADGNALLNSRKDPYDAGIETELEVLVISVSRAELLYDPLTARSYKGAVNRVECWGFPIYTVKCTKFAGVSANKKGIWYWQIDYEFEVAPKGRDWRVSVLDQGYFYTATTGEKRRFLDSRTGQPAPRQGLLDGTGHELLEPRDLFPPVFNKFLLRPTADFNALGLFA